jgi:DNA polymerase III epsilon subunit-like protein
VLDTETTGFGPMDRVIQAAWKIYDSSGTALKSRCELIRPDLWEIPTDAFWVDNGFNTDRSYELGVPIEGVMRELADDVNTVNAVVGHNAPFDVRFVSREMRMLRLFAEIDSSKLVICTMRMAKDLGVVESKGRKMPKLGEVYESLYHEKMVNAHDALADVDACAKSFFTMKEMKGTDGSEYDMTVVKLVKEHKMEHVKNGAYKLSVYGHGDILYRPMTNRAAFLKDGTKIDGAKKWLMDEVLDREDDEFKCLNCGSKCKKKVGQFGDYWQCKSCKSNFNAAKYAKK